MWQRGWGRPKAEPKPLKGLLDICSLQECGVGRWELALQERGSFFVEWTWETCSTHHGTDFPVHSVLGTDAKEPVPPGAGCISIVLVLERPWLGQLLPEGRGHKDSCWFSEGVHRAVCGGWDSGPEGFFRSFLAGAIKALALFPAGMPWSARTISPCQCWNANLSCSTPACGTMSWPMLGCGWGGACQAVGPCLSCVWLNWRLPALALALPRQVPWGSV